MLRSWREVWMKDGVRESARMERRISAGSVWRDAFGELFARDGSACWKRAGDSVEVAMTQTLLSTKKHK